VILIPSQTVLQAPSSEMTFTSQSSHRPVLQERPGRAANVFLWICPVAPRALLPVAVLSSLQPPQCGEGIIFDGNLCVIARRRNVTLCTHAPPVGAAGLPALAAH
jgi:hypothetical protein